MKRTMMLAAAVLVLAGGGLFGARNVAAGGGCHGGVFSDAEGTSVELSNSCFTPTVVRVQRGDAITWTNVDPAAHTVSGVNGVFGEGGKDLLEGESIAYRFDVSGVFPYYCAYHPAMVGAVVVGDGSASAVAAGAGAKLVSAVAAAGPEDAEGSSLDPAEAGDDNGVAVTLVVGAVLAAGLIGTSAGVAIGRRTRSGTA